VNESGRITSKLPDGSKDNLIIRTKDSNETRSKLHQRLIESRLIIRKLKKSRTKERDTKVNNIDEELAIAKGELQSIQPNKYKKFRRSLRF
jgi:hypothetical protein